MEDIDTPHDVDTKDVQEQVPDTRDKLEIVDRIEERRAARNLKYWLVKVFTLTFIILFVASVAAVLYIGVIEKKDLNTSFLGDIFKAILDLLKVLMS